MAGGQVPALLKVPSQLVDRVRVQRRFPFVRDHPLNPLVGLCHRTSKDDPHRPRTRVLVAVSVGLQQSAAPVREDDSDVAPAVQPHGGDQPLFAEMPKIALPGICGSVEVVSQIARGHDPKGENRRERARLRTPEGVLAIARVVDDFTLAPPGQIEIAHEGVTGIALA